jgi:hypothetical protein
MMTAPQSPNSRQRDQQCSERKVHEEALLSLYTRLYAQHVNQPWEAEVMLVLDPCPLCGGLLTFTFPRLCCVACGYEVEA